MVQQAAYKQTSELTRDDRLFILQYFFQANLDHLISRYSRYRELYDRMHANGFVPERALPFFRDNDFTDLQVLSQLAWFDEMFLERDKDLQRLVEKAQGYTFADQQLVERKQRQAIQAVLQGYRSAAERGQIEISTSPFYHPILPLLCDTNVASQPHPGVRLPNRRFRHPEDARMQLERALDLHRRLFGMTPVGLWPSEGSVSEEVLDICASLGLRWVASDQQVLSNSTGVPFYRDGNGVLVNAAALYRPYALATAHGPVQMLFRDHELSDLIGFVYSRMQPEDAARDLVSRIKRSALPLIYQGMSPLVPIILDGENAWEYYRLNGRPFLRELYRLFSEDPQLECVSVREGIERHGRPEPLGRLAAGSWINANFDIWIGAEEDNRAWDLLSDAHDFYSANERNATLEQSTLAREELLIAEGSDWCWWYGPEHSTANDRDFDALYRSHLANVYRALGHAPPDVLSQPIARLQQGGMMIAPTAAITPKIDGMVTNYFEWMGAGYYSPLQVGTTMHGTTPLLREARYGRDSANFYLRLDFSDPALAGGRKLKYRIGFNNSHSRAMTLAILQATSTAPVVCELRRDKDGVVLPEKSAQAALSKILELRLSFAEIGVGSDDPFDFQVTVWEDDYPRETFPVEGWISVPPVSAAEW